MEATEEYDYNDGKWMRAFEGFDRNGDTCMEWRYIPITDVPTEVLLKEYEDIIFELSEKEIELCKVKEEYTVKEFDIVFKSDIDFKSLYGSTSEKVRKQHAKEVLSELSDRKASLELSVEFLKSYIGLLKEVIRSRS